MYLLKLSNYKNAAGVLALAASLPLVLTGCQDEEFGYSADQIKYESNFKKAFGDIPADQSWDLSSYADWQDPLKNYGSDATRANGSGSNKTLSSTEYENAAEYSFVVPQGLLDWMQNRLVEGNDNRYLGSSFMLKMPQSDFAIIPIFQGNSAITSELEIKINGYNLQKIWTKSEGMKSTVDGKTLALGYYEGWANYNQFEPKPSTQGNKYPAYSKNPASTIKATTVWSTPIVFHSAQIDKVNGGYMYLSLHNIAKLWIGETEQASYTKEDGSTGWYTKKDENDDANYLVDEYGKYKNGSMWDSNNNWTTVGDHLTSIHPAGHMLALDVSGSNKDLVRQAISSIDLKGVDKQKCDVMIIACEDANGADTDHDVNDIVFIIVGDLPEVVPTTEYVKKRYMCEDLGGSDDFDFNDIVVDVTQETKYTVESNPSWNSLTDPYFNENKNSTPSIEISGLDRTNYTRSQWARVSHVCGTLPIQAQVGNYLFPWITDPTNLPATRTELCAPGWVYKDGSWKQETNPDNSKPTTRASQYPVLQNGWNPNEQKEISGWDPATNNVKIYVQWPTDWHQKPANGSVPVTEGLNKNDFEGNSFNQLDAVSNPYLDNNVVNSVDFKDFTINNIYAVTFPENGTVPYIIATNQDVPWMEEREPIDMNWLRNAGKCEKDHTGEGSVGSGAYYEYPNDGKPEVVIWKGSITGEIWNHGLSLTEPAQINGIKEALGTEEYEAQCNTLNVYFDKSFTDRGNNDKRISLMKGSWGGRLTTTEADYYWPTRTSENVVTVDGVQCYRLQIKLTDEQMSTMKENGFSFQFASDNVCLRKISFTKEEGFEINLKINEHGKVTTTDNHSRWRDNNAKEMNVPFEQARFVNGQTVHLEATGIGNYVFDHWEKDGASYSTNRAIVISANANLEAQFHYAEPTTLEFEPNKGFQNEITLFVGSKYAYDIKSNNQKEVEFKDVDADMLTVETRYKYFYVTPKAIGTTSFKVYQSEDGTHANSNEITITVNAIDKPTNLQDLTTSMFHRWSSGDNTATIDTNAPGCINSDGSDGNVYGDSNVNYLNYADLSSAKVLLATVEYSAEKQLRFLFNRVEDNGPLLEINPDNNKEYIKAIVNANKELDNYYKEPENYGSKTYIIDLAAIKKDHGFVHLHAIKGLWGSTLVSALQIDDYYCVAEHGLPRILWEGSVKTPASGWGLAEAISIPASRIAATDTYHNTKLRIYYKGQGNGTRGFCPIAGNWGAATPVDINGNIYMSEDGYVDVNMDYRFFADLKYNEKIVFNGTNTEITKVELIKNESTDYNIILDETDSRWGIETQYGRTPLTFTVKETDNNGFGWDNIPSSIISQYNTVMVEIGNVTSKDANGQDQKMSDGKVSLTVYDGKDYRGTNATFNNGTLTISYSTTIKQIYIGCDKQYKVQINKAYLTTK